MFYALLSIIAPHYCCNCGKIGRPLCDCCKKHIIDAQFDNCVLCHQKVKNNNICPKHQVFYDHLWCATYRKGAIAKLIDGYKFQRMQAAATELAEILDASLPKLPDKAVLIPIPTTPKNIRQRGYDHMLLVAKKLAKRRQISYACLLRRRNNTVQHFAKTLKERRKNAQNFFELHGEVDPEVTYIVMDDILTTGSTINAATKVLHQAGAKQIDVAIIARHDKYYRHS